MKPDKFVEVALMPRLRDSRCFGAGVATLSSVLTRHLVRLRVCNLMIRGSNRRREKRRVRGDATAVRASARRKVVQ